MSKFNSRILFFLIPILLISILMEFSLRSIPNDYLYKKEYLEANSSATETLILGNSHSYKGIDPIYFKNNCFNASYVSQSLKYDYEILRKYESRFSNLKTVVLSISYFTMFDKMKTGIESWRAKNYMIYYDMNTSYDISDYSEILNSKLSTNLNRLNNYFIKHNSQITCNSLGWGMDNKNQNSINLEEDGKTAALRHSVNDFRYLEENISILKSFIEDCRKQNIEIILYTPPAYDTYIQNLNKKQLLTTLKTVNEIADYYENCTYLNLLEDESFLASDFENADHLNGRGAKKLSILFKSKIIREK